MKKFISFALAASMALSMVPATAFAASDLTASHSNIRVTANTEFYPKKVADADASLTTREVPYILLEATTDFKYDEQTFELALENAEWLERKDDGDILFVETDEYMTGEDGVKFKPAGSTTTDPGTTPTPTPGAPTVQQAETAYKKAAKSLVEAREAYNEAVKGNSQYVNAKNAYDEAKTDLENKQKAVTDLEKELADAQKALKEAEGLQSAAEAALAVRGEADYQENLKKVLKYTVAIAGGNATNTDSDGNYYFTTGDANLYTSEAALNSAADAELTDDILGDTAAGLYSAKNAAGDSVAAGEKYLYLQLSALGKELLEGPATVTDWTGVTPIASEIKTVELYNSGANTVASSKIELKDDAILTGIDEGFIELSPAGKTRQNENIQYVKLAKAALNALIAAEEAITDAQAAANDMTPAKLEALNETVKNASNEITKANLDVQQAEKVLAEKKAALDAVSNADLSAAQANLEKLQQARESAGIDYMLAMKNATGEEITSTSGAPANLVAWDTSAEVGMPTTNNPDEITAATWVSKYKDAVAAAKAKGIALGAYDVAVGTETLKVEITKKSDSRIIVHTSGYRFKDGDVLSIPLFVRTTGGTASVSIDSLDSEFTSQGKTFAKTADGDTELSIEKVQNFYDDDEVKNLYLEELVAGTIEPGKYISLRVNGDFNLKAAKDGVKVTRITGDGGTDVKVYKKDGDNKYVAFEPGDEADEIYLYVEGTAKSTKATQYRIQGLKIVEDGADFGDEASITVSGGGTSKQTIKIGNYEDFGVKLTAEDKDLPVIYAGAMANSKYDNQTLKVTIEETVANSFIDNRKMEITLPEGVEFVNDSGKRGAAPDSIDDVTEDFKVYNFAGSESDVKKAMTLNDNGTKITISGKDLPDASGTNKDRKRKIEFSVHVSAEADFTGDVVMTLGGPGVADKNVSATVATVKAPIEVRTAVNELKIDYRNTEIADITLVEPEAGLWAKDDIINLEGERMSFESGAKAEVVNGDMKLDKYDGDYIDVNDGVLSVKVSSRSSKTPAEIKISGLSLYMDRSLAAGNYKLKVFGEAKNEFFMNNYDKDGDDFANVFETQKVTVMDDFVKIVTAGRDKDDATFTTKIVVPVGGDTITAGTKEIKLSEMQGGACPPAYINNDGYTMLPVRAVVEALNEIATVRWDDATKTCTIGFGQRVFSMTVGSKVLNLNGVSTALNAAPENKDGRVFLPLRDLGYALGLSDSQISWDSTTQTAQLN